MILILVMQNCVNFGTRKTLTPMQEAVLEVLTTEMKPNEVWSYDRIALRAGYSNSGALRAFVRSRGNSLGLTFSNRGVVAV